MTSPGSDNTPASVSDSKAERIGDHLAALSLDLREWVELRIELAKTEVQEKVDDVTATAKRKGGTIGLVAVAALLALYMLGFVFGAISAAFELWLGREVWGDLATAGLILVMVLVLLGVAKRRQDQDAAIEANGRVEASKPALPPARHPESPTS
ncbi:MAG: phage holin family protein [Bacteroidota bacterium]